MRAHAPQRAGSAPAGVLVSPRARLGFAGVNSQPAFAGGYLRPAHSASGGGRELMQPYLTLTRRELGAYFLSMTGYIIVAAVMFLLGLSFVVLLLKLQQEPTPIPVTELFYITQFFWLILLLATPMITMRLFAQEKSSGTFETLMTTPVSELEVVLAKFTAGLIFYTLTWLPLLGCLLIVRHFVNDPATFDAGVVGSTFLGIVLIGALFVSLGCCASALTRSQVAAAMISMLFGASV